VVLDVNQLGWLAMFWPGTAGVFLGWMSVVSVITFALYALDKFSATRSGNRISEKTLLLGCALGGWPGGILASRLFRHKTIKASYRRKFALAVVVNLFLTCLLAYMFIRSLN